jgi:ion transport protein
MEWVFSTIFTIEMFIKIVAMGFAQGGHAYLKDSWNRLDFSVVLLGYLALLPGMGA